MKASTLILTLALSFTALSPAFAGKAVEHKPEPRLYPLNTCAVSGDKLGEDMGAPYVFIYKDSKMKDDPGRIVKLCCKGCLEDFDADPAKYLKKVDEAAAHGKK